MSTERQFAYDLSKFKDSELHQMWNEADDSSSGASKNGIAQGYIARELEIRSKRIPPAVAEESQLPLPDMPWRSGAGVQAGVQLRMVHDLTPQMLTDIQNKHLQIRREQINQLNDNEQVG